MQPTQSMTSIVFGTRRTLARDSHLNQSMGRSQYSELEKLNYFFIIYSIIFDDCLVLSDHIDAIFVKMGQVIAITRKSFPCVTSSVRNQVKQHLFSHSYSTVWLCGISKNSSSDKIEPQDRFFTALFKPTNVIKLHCNLSWLTVQAKLTSSLLMFAQNAIGKEKTHFWFILNFQTQTQPPPKKIQSFIGPATSDLTTYTH